MEWLEEEIGENDLGIANTIDTTLDNCEEYEQETQSGKKRTRENEQPKAKKKAKFAALKAKKKQAQQQIDNIDQLSIQEQIEVFNQIIVKQVPAFNIEIDEERFVTSNEHQSGDNHHIVELAHRALQESGKEAPFANPVVIVLCSSARRCAELCKPLRGDTVRGIEKLFAKHLKLSDQVESLKRSRFGIAVGTPNRLLKLCEIGALQFNDTDLVILDMKRDKKNYHLLSLQQLRVDLVTLLAEHILDSSSSTRMCLC